MMRHLFILIAFLLLPLNAVAHAQQDYGNTELADPAREREAKALMDTIRCVVCQGQSIADSNANIAYDMRALIRERIAAGEKPEDIRRWLISRYGDWVSFQPALSARSAPLWIVPLLALLIGGLLMRMRFKRRTPS